MTTVLTDNGREFCGTDNHPYELYLALNDIERRRTRVRSPQTNGFVERFQRTVPEEFLVPALRTTFYDTVDALQADLDRWLLCYKTQRPHQGYRREQAKAGAELQTICSGRTGSDQYTPAKHESDPRRSAS